MTIRMIATDSDILHWGRRFVRENTDDLRAGCGNGTADALSDTGTFMDNHVDLYLGFFYNEVVPHRQQRSFMRPAIKMAWTTMPTFRQGRFSGPASPEQIPIGTTKAHSSFKCYTSGGSSLLERARPLQCSRLPGRLAIYISIMPLRTLGSIFEDLEGPLGEVGPQRGVTLCCQKRLY